MVLQQSKISISEKNARSWWIVFKNSESDHIGKVTKKGFGHCYAFTHMGDLVFGFEPMMGAVNHIVTTSKFSDMLAAQKLAGFKVVHLRWRANHKKFMLRPPLMTCSGYLAYTIGIPFFGVTPYQLYNKIMKLGGEEI